MTFLQKISDKISEYKDTLAILIVIVVTSAIAGVWLVYDNRKQVEATLRYDVSQTTTMKAICPSLLSIGRSSRDTLIVMKAEPLCNRYVMETLK